ncbi:MAG: hypothetical protein ACUVTU_12835 [Desulfurispora sp.]|uniref:hypothetical protein n=1 Tax=Desulfurispora sp. TaxID=3014275 RepID=UPI004049BE1E
MADFCCRLFFDESGKNHNNPFLMGALMIPENIYGLSDIVKLNKELKEGLCLHWASSSGEKYAKDIVRLFNCIMKYHKLLRLIVLRYMKPGGVDAKSFKSMIYEKLPERILYGLLRSAGCDLSIKATVHIERATEYVNCNLQKKIVEQLNMQAIYRGENFRVTDCKLTPKGEEIGLELTDILLGVIRTIVKNAGDNTNRAIFKNHLGVRLLKDDRFYAFISSLRYFEWNNSRELYEVNFNKYLQSFLANRREWLEHLEA